MFPSTVASSSCENKSSASSSADSGEGNLCHFVLELFPVKKRISSSYRTTIMSVNCFLRLPKSDSAREFGGQQSSGCHFSQATGLEDRSTGLVGLDTGKTCPSSYLKQFHLSTFLNFLTVYTMDTLMRQCSQRQETETWYLITSLHKRTATPWKGILGGTHFLIYWLAALQDTEHNTASKSMPQSFKAFVTQTTESRCMSVLISFTS